MSGCVAVRLLRHMNVSRSMTWTAETKKLSQAHLQVPDTSVANTVTRCFCDRQSCITGFPAFMSQHRNWCERNLINAIPFVMFTPGAPQHLPRPILAWSSRDWRIHWSQSRWSTALAEPQVGEPLANPQFGPQLGNHYIPLLHNIYLKTIFSIWKQSHFLIYQNSIM